MGLKFYMKKFRRKSEPVMPEIGGAITKEDLDKMLDEYCDLRGWTRDGVPKCELLTRLGLQEG